jgi:glycosyltransferase involved in cell wall biosynthesis
MPESATGARTRVLFMLPTLRGGGAERVFTSLLRHIDRGAIDARLAVLDASGAVYRDDLPPDLEVIDLRAPRLRHSLPSIVRVIWRIRPDVVFSTLGHLNLALAALRPLLPPGTRLLGRETAMVSMLDDPGYEPQPAWVSWAYRRFLHKLDAVVCQSESMKADLVDHFTLRPEKGLVIRNPVDVRRIRERAREPVDAALTREPETIQLVAAGSFLPRKGFDVLVDAIASCANRRLRLTILGEGPLKAQIVQRAAEKGVASQIRFLEFQSNPYAFFARADAFVLSSRFEGVPNVVLEALACGTPVIATPAPGGVVEILSGIDHCLVARAVTPAALAEAIDAFRPGPRIAPEAIAPFDVHTIAGQYERLFAQLTDRAPQPAPAVS